MIFLLKKRHDSLLIFNQSILSIQTSLSHEIVNKRISLLRFGIKRCYYVFSFCFQIDRFKNYKFTTLEFDMGQNNCFRKNIKYFIKNTILTTYFKEIILKSSLSISSSPLSITHGSSGPALSQTPSYSHFIIY